MTLKPCGTPAALRRHYLRGEEVDAACRAAGNEYKQAARAGVDAARDAQLAYRVHAADPDTIRSVMVDLMHDPGLSKYVRGVIATTLLRHLTTHPKENDR